MAWKSKALAAFGAALLTTSAGSLAQTTTTDPALDPTAGTVPNDDDDGDEGRWGLLGLLGLAGLMGMKRRDRDDHRHTTGTTTNRM